MIENKDKLIPQLKNVAFFYDMHTDFYHELLKISSLVNFPPDKLIFQENDEADNLYIILKGSVTIIKYFEDKSPKIIAKRVQNEILGEMAIFNNKPRSASAITDTETTMIEIKKKDFNDLLNDQPSFWKQIALSLSSKLRETDMALINDLQKQNIELQKAYDELKNTQQELIKAERLSTVGDLASRIIHDIKNPMTTIRGFAEMLSRDTITDDQRKKFSKTIVNSIDQLVDMTQEILDFARGISVTQLKPIKMKDFIDTLSSVIQVEFELRNILYEAKCSYDGYMLMDAGKMKRAIYNIINNARDIMKNGDHFYLKCYQLDDDHFEISLKDTGSGIPEKIQKKIFEPFFTYNKTRGTGLGLAIVKKIIEDHQGTISFETEAGKGTTFYLKFEIPKFSDLSDQKKIS